MASNLELEEPSSKKRRVEGRSIALNMAEYKDWVQDLSDEELVEIFKLGVLVKESVTMSVDFNQNHLEELLASKTKPMQDCVASIEENVKRQVQDVQVKVSQDVGKNINEMTSSVQDLKNQVSSDMSKIKEDLFDSVTSVARKVPPLDSLCGQIYQSAESVKSQMKTEIGGLEQRVGVEIKACQDQLRCLSSSLEKPSTKGSLGERTVMKVLQEHFPNFSLYDVTRQKGKGDINAETQRGHKIMIEVKNHKNPVPRDEIERFEQDLANSPDFKVGILFSCESSIAKRSLNGKVEVSVGRNRNQYMIFVPNSSKDEAAIVWSVLMADELAEISGELAETKTRELKIIYEELSKNLQNAKQCRGNLESLKNCVKNLEDSVTPILDIVHKARNQINALLR